MGGLVTFSHTRCGKRLQCCRLHSCLRKTCLVGQFQSEIKRSIIPGYNFCYKHLELSISIWEVIPLPVHLPIKAWICNRKTPVVPLCLMYTAKEKGKLSPSWSYLDQRGHRPRISPVWATTGEELWYHHMKSPRTKNLQTILAWTCHLNKFLHHHTKYQYYLAKFNSFCISLSWCLRNWPRCLDFS